MPDDPKHPADKTPSIDEKSSTSELRKASDVLKAKIDDAKRRNDMPLDSNLGNPTWEKNAADGHLDVHENEDDE